MILGLFVALGVVTLAFVCAWVYLAWKGRAGIVPGEKRHYWYHSIVGFVFGFFDTLGIGNFAPTTSAFKLRGSVPDEKIPGTLNVGYALPTVVQALIYITIVNVDPWTLVLMIGAAVLGAWLGAGIVSRWPRRNIQIGMAFALLAAATLFVLKQFNVGPPDGEARALEGPTLWIGLAGNFALGALMTLGIGLYGPCLILVSLLGMDPRAAFPIMMGSCAFLMPIGGIRFVRAGSYSLSASLALTVFAIPGVLIAAFVFEKMELYVVRWLVIVVVIVTAVMMLRSALLASKGAPATPASPTPPPTSPP